MIGATLAVCGMIACGGNGERDINVPALSVQFGLPGVPSLPGLPRGPSAIPGPLGVPSVPGMPGGPSAPSAPVGPSVPGLPNDIACAIPTLMEPIKQVKDTLGNVEKNLREDLRQAKSDIANLEKKLSDLRREIVAEVKDAATAPFSAIGSEVAKALNNKINELQATVMEKAAPFAIGALLFVLLLISLIVGLPVRAVMRRGR